MLVNSVNEKFSNLFFTIMASCLLAIMIVCYGYKAFLLLLIFILIIFYIAKIEYVFYIILASRSIFDIYYNLESAGNAKVTQIIAVLIIGMFSFYFISAGYRIFHLGVNKIYGTFLLSSIVPVFFTNDLISGLGGWLKINQGFFFLNMTILLVLAMRGELYKKRTTIICWCTIAAIIIPYLLFLNNIIQGKHEIRAGYIRYATFGSYGNLFSYCLLSVFPVCLFFYSLSIKRIKKIIWFAFVVILLITIYKTYTRNVWIGVVIMLLTWCVLRKNTKGVLFILGLCILMVIVNSSVRDRFSDIHKLFESQGTSYSESNKLLSGRYSIWESNIDYFITNSSMIEKLFGNGYDIKEKVTISHPYIEHIEEHNNYLSLLMSTGICGLLLYYFYILRLFQESFKLLRKTNNIFFKNLAQVFISVLFAYVIMCFFTHMIWKTGYQYYFSALAGFIIAANILEDKRRDIGTINNCNYLAS